MKKITSIGLFFLLTVLLCKAQEPSEALKQVFSDAEYFLASEFYTDALPEYVKIYKRGYANNANVNYRIGICYLNIPGKKAESIPYFQKAILNLTSNYLEGSLKESKAPYDAYLYLGNAYRINNDLDKAIEAYNKYLELIGPKPSDMLTYAKKQIEACNVAKKLEASPVNVNFVNLGNVINNASGNYKPVVSGDEQYLAYMNHLKFYDAIYLSKKVNGKWQEPENLTPMIMSDGDQYTSALSYDGTILLLTKEDQFNSDIYMSQKVDGKWTPSKPLNKNINTKYWESHACLTKDGKRLYFASNRTGGFGEMDIYYSDKQAKGEWGPASNIGSVINTALSEDCPFITPDGKTLYFSSQGHENMGGFDIFKSTMNDKGEWSEPVNLGYPVNKTDDDLFFDPVGDGSVGYMALYEKSGFGDQDIYRIEILPAKPKEVTAKEDTTKPKEVVTPIETARDTAVKAPEKEVKTVEPVKEVVKETAKEVPAVKITVQPVFFEFNQATLSDATKSQLDLLVKALKAYPDIRIEIVGHTDSKGTNEFNKTLGLKRAEIIKNYLTARGINSIRVTTSSKGESAPIARNTNADGSDNPEGRKINRRVEFIITAGNNGQLILEPVQIPEGLKIN